MQLMIVIFDRIGHCEKCVDMYVVRWSVMMSKIDKHQTNNVNVYSQFPAMSCGLFVVTHVRTFAYTI